MEIRRPDIKDVPAIVDLVNHYAGNGLMLPRSRHTVYQDLRDFLIATEEGRLIGCGALHIVWEDMAEVRSLAVDPAYEGRGVGRRIVEELIEEARALGLPRVFALTYVQGFFERLGFRVAPKEALPHKIWGDCLNCPKFPNCDEVALIRDLVPETPIAQAEE